MNTARSRWRTKSLIWSETGLGWSTARRRSSFNLHLHHSPINSLFPDATVVTGQTDKTQLGKLQDHPVLQRLLQCKVLHGGEEVGTSHDVVLQLDETEKPKCVNVSVWRFKCSLIIVHIKMSSNTSSS